MLEICVRQDGSGHFTSVSEAVLAVPYDLPAVIDIGPGVYREKLVCEKKWVTLRGAGANKTRLVWGDGGKLPYADPRDARPTHTFRSYTAFFSGESVRVEDLTIENDAGAGAQAGQGIAAYVDAAHAVFERVQLLGHQDTLFCAPLPDEEREKDGFLGPRMLSPRRASAQYYHACAITGDIDFIFGGADALFEGCTIRSRNTPPQELNGTHGYVTAPCGKADALGFVFEHCEFVSDCPTESVYLGRPWRPEGKAAVLHSRLGAHIRPEGFSPWGTRTDFALSGFAECGNTGAGAQARPAPVRMLSEEQAAQLLQTARARCCENWRAEKA
jgi:pectinesterase